MAELAGLARTVFGGHPWYATPTEISRLMARLARDAGCPGFALFLAEFLAEDTTIHPVGFAYGRPARHLAALADRCALGAAPPFELRELGVVPGARRRGIGAALHDALAASTPPGPRWLVTHPHAPAALALYRARGWQAVRLLPVPGGTVRVLMHRPH